MQTRSNNRIVFAGSLEIFSNAFYEENGDNQILGDTLSLWTFKYSGYLRVSNIEHFKYSPSEDRIDPNHEILVQAVQKANLPTSQ